MMRMRVTSRNLATHGLFGALFLTLLGTGLLFAWCVQMRATVMFYALCAIPTVVLLGMIVRRHRRHWPIDSGRSPENTLGARRPWDRQVIPWYVLLVAVGAAIGVLVNVGSVFVVALTSLVLVLVPWATFAVCVRQFYCSSMLLIVGAALGVLSSGTPVHPFHYLIAAWSLLITALTTVLAAVFTHGDHRDRMPLTGYRASTTAAAADSTASSCSPR